MVPSKSGAVEFLRQIERGNPVLSSNRLKFGPLDLCCGIECKMLNKAKTIYSRQGSVITHLPGEEKSVELDEGGSGFPPDDSDGSRGGGNWLGGFFFFGLLAFLGFLEDKESEGCFYCDDRRRGGFTFVPKIGRPFAFVSVLLFILVWSVPFAIRILRRYNLLAGLTSRGSFDGRLSRLLNWRCRSADSSSELTSHANGHFNPECCICLAEYEDNVEIRILPRSHVFHLECVNQWLRIQSFCPLCKRHVQR